MSAELSEILENHIYHSVVALLADFGYKPDNCSFHILTGDGSDRRFIRVISENSSVIVILAGRGSSAVAEARSSWQIGKHLLRCGVPVPDMISHDSETGAVLCEDLGDTLLHQHLQRVNETERVRLYQEAVDILVNMQVRGREGFSSAMCWDQPVYDRKTMLERESGYFLEACCRELLGEESVSSELESEFSDLAELASRQSPEFFLHRDFQSRNIMVKNDHLRVIDYQGGRFGPLAYDLASLLIDPYVELSDEIRVYLREYYLDQVSELVALGRDEFVESYSWLAIQRNLQILGAFAFLSREKGKTFFGQFLYPAAVTLKGMLDVKRKRFPVLQSITNDLVAYLGENSSPFPRDER